MFYDKQFLSIVYEGDNIYVFEVFSGFFFEMEIEDGEVFVMLDNKGLILDIILIFLVNCQGFVKIILSKR